MSGFESPNYTQIPNDLFEKYMPDMGMAELKVVMALARETFGYNRTQKRMSIRKLAKATGLTARNAYNGAIEAVKRGLIGMEQDGGVTIWSVIVEDTPVVARDTTVSPTDTPSKKENRKKKDSTQKTSKDTCPAEWMNALYKICGIDPALASIGMRKQISEVGKALINTSAAASDLDRFREWWVSDAWRRDNRPITPNVIRNEWAKFKAAKIKSENLTI